MCAVHFLDTPVSQMLLLVFVPTLYHPPFIQKKVAFKWHRSAVAASPFGVSLSRDIASFEEARWQHMNRGACASIPVEAIQDAAPTHVTGVDGEFHDEAVRRHTCAEFAQSSGLIVHISGMCMCSSHCVSMYNIVCMYVCHGVYIHVNTCAYILVYAPDYYSSCFVMHAC